MSEKFDQKTDKKEFNVMNCRIDQETITDCDLIILEARGEIKHPRDLRPRSEEEFLQKVTDWVLSDKE